MKSPSTSYIFRWYEPTTSETGNPASPRIGNTHPIQASLGVRMDLQPLERGVLQSRIEARDFEAGVCPGGLLGRPDAGPLDALFGEQRSRRLWTKRVGRCRTSCAEISHSGSSSSTSPGTAPTSSTGGQGPERSMARQSAAIHGRHVAGARACCRPSRRFPPSAHVSSGVRRDSRRVALQ